MEIDGDRWRSMRSTGDNWRSEFREYPVPEIKRIRSSSCANIHKVDHNRSGITRTGQIIEYQWSMIPLR
eukprot:1392159-Amorphochlora_amoeboformis.AAC.1